MDPNSRGNRILWLLHKSQSTISSSVEPIPSTSRPTTNVDNGNENDENPNRLRPRPFVSANNIEEDSLSMEEDDSDADKNYVPIEQNSSDSDTGILIPDVSLLQKNKVGISNKRMLIANIQGDKSHQNQVPVGLLETDGFVSTDDETLDPVENETVLEEGGHIKRKVKNKSKCNQLGKKRVVNVNDWACNVRKRKRAGGQEYVSKKGKVVAAKEMKPSCSCRMKCSERLLENERQEIFDAYWSKEKSVQVKRQFILTCVESYATVRSRIRLENSNKSKENTLFYYFTVNNQRIRVCKPMFLNTLSISNTVVVNALKKVEPGGIIKQDQRGRQTPSNKTSVEIIESVKKHISSFPQYESHYSRERSSRKYLGIELSIQKMYDLYIDDCNKTNVEPKQRAKLWLYSDIFNKQYNFTFKPPEIDTCDVCDSYYAKLKNNLTEDEKESIQADQNAHLTESKTRYNLKSNDTKVAKENPRHKVLTGDLQKCLPSPLTTNCISFYKRKLWTLNFTLYDTANSSVHCAMWDESKGARGGNEIASSILKWCDTVISNSEIEEITLWTDNCYGQNKNVSMIMCFFWILHKYPQIKTITQKFLLKGHTHMEADSAHALIERKRKKLHNLAILTPWDWQQLVRQTSSKYIVHNMELEDFKSFNTLYDKKQSCNPPFVNRKKDVGKQQVLLSTCVQLQVKQEKIGSLFLKTNFEGESQEVDFIRFRRQELVFPTDLNQVSKEPIPISKQKYDDLIALLPFVPSVCHDFYKNLKYR